MAHAGSGLVQLTDYNNILTTGDTVEGLSLQDIFGTGNGTHGYGGNSINVAVSELSTLSAGSVITNDDWLNVRNAQNNMAAHQGTTLVSLLPSITDLEDGVDADLIKPFEDQEPGDNPDGEIDSQDNLDILVLNRDVVSPGNVTVATKLTSVRGTAWGALIQHIFTVDFGSADNARFFFNTGGQIRLSATRTGGSATAQNAVWDGILALGGTFIFQQDAYFALVGSYPSPGTPPTGSRFTAAYGGYANNYWDISSFTNSVGGGGNGGNGSIITFRSLFVDGHTNIFSDTIDGTFTSTIEERRSTGIFVRPSPIFATETIPDGELTAGS